MKSIIPIPLSERQRGEASEKLKQLLKIHHFSPMSYGFWAVPEDFRLKDSRNGLLRTILIFHPNGELFTVSNIFYVKDSDPEVVDTAKSYTLVMWREK